MMESKFSKRPPMWMRMATLAVALLAVPRGSADDSYTASMLYADCTTGNRRFCEGVLFGHYAGIGVVIVGNSWRFNCKASDTTALRLGFKKYVEANPAKLNDIPSVILQAWIKGGFCNAEKRF